MFSDIFVELLQVRNVSSYKLTKDTGIDNGLISKWKNGLSTPSAEMLIKLADYFKVSTDYLLGRTSKTRRGENMEHVMRQVGVSTTKSNEICITQENGLMGEEDAILIYPEQVDLLIEWLIEARDKLQMQQ